ncbi:hypothetical protein NXS19_013449 [Fusarium pseudograminearum]|nr:hypothetical protein NXS19_013449 [Fusarium pseudograminearum]
MKGREIQSNGMNLATRCKTCFIDDRGRRSGMSVTVETRESCKDLLGQVQVYELLSQLSVFSSSGRNIKTQTPSSVRIESIASRKAQIRGRRPICTMVNSPRRHSYTASPQ